MYIVSRASSTATATTTSAGESGPHDTVTPSSLVLQIDNLRACTADGTCFGDEGLGSTCGSPSSSGSTTGSGSSGGSTTTAHCATGSCYSWSVGICCPRATPYACKGRCYVSTDAAKSGGGCTDFKMTCSP